MGKKEKSRKTSIFDVVTRGLAKERLDIQGDEHLHMEMDLLFADVMHFEWTKTASLLMLNCSDIFMRQHLSMIATCSKKFSHYNQTKTNNEHYLDRQAATCSCHRATPQIARPKDALHRLLLGRTSKYRQGKLPHFEI